MDRASADHGVSAPARCREKLRIPAANLGAGKLEAQIKCHAHG